MKTRQKKAIYQGMILLLQGTAEAALVGLALWAYGLGTIGIAIAVLLTLIVSPVITEICSMSLTLALSLLPARWRRRHC